MWINIVWEHIKIKLSTGGGMVLTLCQWIKKMWNVDNLWGKKLELSECQSPRCNGDNPLDPLFPTFSGFVFPHFTTAYGPHIY